MILRGNKWLLGEINDFKGKWMILKGNKWNMMKKYQKGWRNWQKLSF